MIAMNRHDNWEEGMRKAGVYVLAAVLIASIAGSADAARTGKEIYEAVCQACHTTGVSGAPKFGDKQWLSLEKKEGIKELTKDAIKGVKAMPPKGGCTDCTEAEIKAAVRYLIDSARKK